MQGKANITYTQILQRHIFFLFGKFCSSYHPGRQTLADKTFMKLFLLWPKLTDIAEGEIHRAAEGGVIMI